MTEPASTPEQQQTTPVEESNVFAVKRSEAPEHLNSEVEAALKEPVEDTVQTVEFDGQQFRLAEKRRGAALALSAGLAQAGDVDGALMMIESLLAEGEAKKFVKAYVRSGADDQTFFKWLEDTAVLIGQRPLDK